MKRKTAMLLTLLIVSAAMPSSPSPSPEAVIAMCRPTVEQIQNIVELFERDLINLRKIRLLAFYHEEETTDYRPSHDYVMAHKLGWIRFYVVRGEVPVARLFQENAWSDQFRHIFSSSHGLILTGGMDIPPAIYRQPTHLHTTPTTPIRSLYECSLAFHLLGGQQNPDFEPYLESRPDYPVLGICLGLQTINVAAGGTLIQDIPTQVYGVMTVEEVLALGPDSVHSASYFKALHPAVQDLPPAFHRIRFKEGSRFLKRTGWPDGNHPVVLTSHHQSIGDLGQDLIVIATSMDGRIIEAVEHRKYPNVVGVQFHPEFRDLFRKRSFYREAPGQPADLTLGSILNRHPNAMDFHQRLWLWFSESLASMSGSKP